MDSPAWANVLKHLGLEVNNSDDPNWIPRSDLGGLWGHEVCSIIKQEIERQGGDIKFTPMYCKEPSWQEVKPIIKDSPLLSRTTHIGLYRIYRLTEYFSTLSTFQRVGDDDWQRLQEKLGIVVENCTNAPNSIAGADLAIEWRSVVCNLINDAIEVVAGQESRLDGRILNFDSVPHLDLKANPCM